MSVTERVMGTGSWSLRLKADTPRTILDALTLETVGFGHVVVTRNRIKPDNYSDATILGLARYTGVFRSRDDNPFGDSNQTEIGGPGLAMWLADEDGKGNIYQAPVVLSAATLTTAMGSLKPLALTSGTYTNPAGTVTQTFLLTDPRTAINTVCQALGAEWRINPNFTIDAGTITALGYTTTPTAVIVRKLGDSGRDLNVTGIHGQVAVKKDLEDYSTAVIYVTRDRDDVPSIQVANLTTTFKDPQGNAVILQRAIESNDDPAITASLAAAELAQVNNLRNEITVSTTSYDIAGDVKIGDYVWVYDPANGLYDTNNELTYRGRTIHPTPIRVLGYTWAVREGFGVYFRFKSGSTVTYTDLTPYVVFEDGGTELEIGSTPRSLTTGGGSRGGAGFPGGGGGSVPDATTSIKGIVQLADSSTTVTGTSTTLVTTPAGVKAVADTKAALSHTHTASQISDATTIGRNVLTAADAAAVRTLTGAGTSSLVIGTTGGTAKDGAYQPTAANISDSTATGRSVLTAASTSAARTAIGAGTSSLVIGTTGGTAKDGAYQPASTNISDATTVGKAVLTAASAAAARSTLGAGTSSIVVGTGAGDAKAGNYQPTIANISDAGAEGKLLLATTSNVDAQNTLGATVTGKAVFTAVDAAAGRTALGVLNSQWSDVSGGVNYASGSVGVGATPVASAILELSSTTQGMLPPRMTSTQRNAISSPATGLTVYDTTISSLVTYSGSVWQVLVVSTDTGWVSLSLGTGWTATSGEVPAYRVLNGVCYLQGRAVSTGASNLLATLPSGARPTLQVIATIDNGTGTSPYGDRMRVNTNGNLEQLIGAVARTNVAIGGFPPYLVT